MKKNIVLIIAFSLILMSASVSLAQDSYPQIPERFYGTVMLNGEVAPDGTEVSAWVDGVEVITQTTIDGKYGYVPPASEEFQVSADSGSTIVFKLYDKEVATDTFSSGDITELDLSGTGITVPETTTPSTEEEATSMSGGFGGFSAPDTMNDSVEEVSEDIVSEEIISDESASDDSEEATDVHDEESATEEQEDEPSSPSTPGFAGVTSIIALMALYVLKRNE